MRVLGFLHQFRERGVDAVQRGVDELTETPDLVAVAHAEAAAEVTPGAERQEPIREPDGPGDPYHHQGHQQLDSDQQGDQQDGADVQPQGRQLGAHRPLLDLYPQGRDPPPVRRARSAPSSSASAASRVDSDRVPRA